MNPLRQKQAFFDGAVPQWIRDTGKRSAHLAEIFRAYDLPVVAPVLDVGGGAGILLPFLREQLAAAERPVSVAPDHTHHGGQPFRVVHGSHGMTSRKACPAEDGRADIVELEISVEMLRMARALHGNDADAAYVQADAHLLPFPDGHFGSVHCFSVFPHFDHPLQALAEFRRCLRPGGALCILHLMGHEELNALHRDAGREVAEDRLPPVHRLSGIVEDAGFIVRRAEERSDLYLLLAERP